MSRRRADELFAAGDARAEAPRAPAGDHKGNSIIRFFWKGAGVGDDKWI